jgi:hypothetical protein
MVCRDISDASRSPSRAPRHPPLPRGRIGARCCARQKTARRLLRISSGHQSVRLCRGPLPAWVHPFVPHPRKATSTLRVGRFLGCPMLAVSLLVPRACRRQLWLHDKIAVRCCEWPRWPMVHKGMADVRRHNSRVFLNITHFLPTHSSSAGAVPFMNSVPYKNRTHFPV